jgi:hypothetical protein
MPRIVSISPPGTENGPTRSFGARTLPDAAGAGGGAGSTAGTCAASGPAAAKARHRHRRGRPRWRKGNFIGTWVWCGGTIVLIGMKSHPVPMTSRGFGLFPSRKGCHKHPGGGNPVFWVVGSRLEVGACLQAICRGVARRRPRAHTRCAPSQTIACKQAPTFRYAPCKIGREEHQMPSYATLG